MKTTSSFLDLPQSGIRRMYDLAKNKKDTVSIVLGEPDFVTPKHIIEAAKKKLDEGCTHYTDNAGILPLRQEISRALKQYDKVDYDPEGEIVVTVPVYEKDNFNFTYENLKSRVTDKTKAIILNSPCNPTGGVATRETMETVAKVALEYDLYVIYDAVYKHLIYNDTDYINIAVLDGMRERTIYVDSFSKTYAMTGWRLGYMAGPRNILSRLPKLQENMPSCLPEFVQYAGIEALKNGDEDIAMMNRQYAERRKLVLERINGIKGLSCTPPNGAFYAFVNIKETGMTSVEFCEKLLEKEGVVTAPGSASAVACCVESSD